VQTVAENFGLSAQMVRRWNGLRGDSLHGRTVLALHLPVTPTGEQASAAPARQAKHSTKKTVAATAKGSEARSAKASDDEEASEQASVLHHKVRSGETFYSIATTYKTTVAALKRNNQNVATLRPGMILVVQQSQ
jgi:LysM repeat protein